MFNLATDYTDGHNRIVGTSALSSVDSFNRNRARLQPNSLSSSRQRLVDPPAAFFPSHDPRRANSVDEPVRRGQRQQVDNRIKMGMQIDDRGFQALLLETQVLTAREHTKWNYDALMELIEGPMLNPKRLEEAIKVSKFGRRLMQFFHPQMRRGFADVKKTKSNQKWVKLGCTLITTLLSNADGVRFLQSEDPFMKQLADCFADIDPVCLHFFRCVDAVLTGVARQTRGSVAQDPTLSKVRVEETLTYGYIEMLGTMSRYPEGVELLERFKIFTAFYRVSELRSREDLVKLIIENIDYTQDGHPRILLSKALTSSYMVRHCQFLLRRRGQTTP